MPSKLNKLLFVLAAVMLVGVVGARPLWAQDVFPQPLDGWEMLKFGMTPRQTCDAMNKASLKCTIECLKNSQCQLGILHTNEAQVRIGTTTWSVKPFFDAVGGVTKLDGKLEAIRLQGDVQSCDLERILGPLEERYGTFRRTPAYAERIFANGAALHVSVCLVYPNRAVITYLLNPNGAAG